MSRPYTADGQGRYRVKVANGARVCDTRAHAGAYATWYRSQMVKYVRPEDRKRTDGDRITWNGTLDPLARAPYQLIADRKPCACCGTKSKGRYVLSDYGRKLLARRRAAQ